MNKSSPIFIVGNNDSIDQSLLRYFKSAGFTSVFSNTRDRINVLSQKSIDIFFTKIRPQFVFLGSIRSGGIVANQTHPGEFIYENILAQSHVIHAAHQHHVKKLLYFSGSCAYPKNARQPILESALLTGPLEATSEAYSIAKIAGGAMCQAYRAQYKLNALCAVPATLYGPGCHTDLEHAHVMGALIAKFEKAIYNNEQHVTVWGTGKPRREFLYEDDFVSACICIMERTHDFNMINIGVGSDVTIKQLALLIKQISGFKGKIIFDTSKPDGTMRKLMHHQRITSLGWKPKVSLEDGIYKTIQWFRKGRR